MGGLIVVVWCCVFCYLLFGWLVLFVACWIVLVSFTVNSVGLHTFF